MRKFKNMFLKATMAAALLAGGFLAGMTSPSAEATKSSGAVEVIANGQVIQGEILEGTAYVPAKSLGQALGRNVTWNAEKRSVHIESRLDTILKRGVIRVGTTGDYRPFTYVNPKTGEYEGYDIDAAKLLAKDLGVKVEFVQTSWPNLMNDLLADKFDMAVGGITRNVARQKTAHLTQPYIDFGKSPLIHVKNKDRFKSLADIDQPDVTIAVNPGGTNQKFVDANMKQAKVTVIENNLDIPHLIAEGKYDVMITDNVEAMLYAKEDSRLYAALTDQTFTVDQKGYLMHRGDEIFANWVELWMDEMKLKGKFAELHKKWLE